MIYPGGRFRFMPNKSRRRKRIAKIFLFLCVAGLLGTGVSWFVKQGFKYMPSSDSTERKKVLSLWESKNYQEIIKVTDGLLEKKPMSSYNLIFNGFAHFYTAVNQATVEEKNAHIEKAIVALRRARLHDRIPLSGEVDYVLGKAYYQKGMYYADLSAQYMLSSIERQYVGQDSYEYLGLAYSNLGNHAESLKYFLKAIESSPTDLLFLTVAQSYYQLGDKASCEEYLMRAINKSSDSRLVQKARFMLGDIYFQNKEYLKSEEQYQKILENNSQSSDAYFCLGEIYFAMGDNLKARAFWRRTLRIDPNHFGALRRLYK